MSGAYARYSLESRPGGSGTAWLTMTCSLDGLYATIYTRRYLRDIDDSGEFHFERVDVEWRFSTMARPIVESWEFWTDRYRVRNFLAPPTDGEFERALWHGGGTLFVRVSHASRVAANYEFAADGTREARAALACP